MRIQFTTKPTRDPAEGGGQNAPNSDARIAEEVHSDAATTSTTSTTAEDVYAANFNDLWYATAYTLIIEQRICQQCHAVHEVPGNPMVRLDCVLTPHRHRLVKPEHAPAAIDKALLPRTHTTVELRIARCTRCFRETPDVPAPPAPTMAEIMQRRLNGSGAKFTDPTAEAPPARAKKKAPAKPKPVAASLSDFL